jgi:pimeloyl-ACP methyl ester carboxylesterase
MASVSSPPHPSAHSACWPKRGCRPQAGVSRLRSQGSPWRNVDWRTHQHWTIINDSPVNVIELGEGPPLLFIHGLSGHWPNWLEQLPAFAGTRTAAGHRVLTLDLPGFGHSPMPPEPISISGYARTLEQLLDAHGISAAAVVGHSMGGFIAAELAIAFPQRVERLALVSPAGLSTYGDPRGLRTLSRLRRMERPVTAYAGWLAAHADALSRRRRLRSAVIGLVASHPSRLPAPLAAEQLRGTGKPGFAPALQAILEYDFRHRLGEIVSPTLIVWGDRDRVITARDAERFAEVVPNSRKVVLEDTGHAPMFERPAEFNALLAEFLDE